MDANFNLYGGFPNNNNTGYQWAKYKNETDSMFCQNNSLFEAKENEFKPDTYLMCAETKRRTWHSNY